MKSPICKLMAALLLAALVPAVSSHAGEPETPLASSMEKLNDAYKSLSRALKAPDAAQKASYVEWAATITDQAMKALDLVPELISELPAEKQAEMKDAYHKDMKAFVATATDLEKALTEERWADADALLKDMRKAKSDGHHAYKKE